MKYRVDIGFVMEATDLNVAMLNVRSFMTRACQGQDPEHSVNIRESANSKLSPVFDTTRDEPTPRWIDGMCAAFGLQRVPK